MCKPDVLVCSKCKREVFARKMRHDGICYYCVQYYRKNGTYERKHKRRTAAMDVRVCQQCKSRPVEGYRGGKYVCKRCYAYYDYNAGQRHRPRHLDANICVICGAPLNRTYGGNYGGNGRCHTCATYRRNHGKDRTEEMIYRLSPHGFCDCGKPATKPVDLRTGYLYVSDKFSKEEFRDGAEWVEWMCDECAGLEAEMQQLDTGNEYRATGWLNTREVGR